MLLDVRVLPSFEAQLDGRRVQDTSIIQAGAIPAESMAKVVELSADVCLGGVDLTLSSLLFIKSQRSYSLFSRKPFYIFDATLANNRAKHSR